MWLEIDHRCRWRMDAECILSPFPVSCRGVVSILSGQLWAAEGDADCWQAARLSGYIQLCPSLVLVFKHKTPLKNAGCYLEKCFLPLS